MHNIEAALKQERYETARRMCLADMERRAHEYTPAEHRQILLYLHHAYCALGDIRAASAVLDDLHPGNHAEKLELLLLRAEVFHRASSYDHYRVSKEARAGMTGEEYEAKWKSRADKCFEQAATLARTKDERIQLISVLKRCRRKPWVSHLLAELKAEAGHQPHEVHVPVETAVATGTLTGTLRWPGGSPAIPQRVILGLSADDVLTVEPDEAGTFVFPAVPAGTHPFLAVTFAPDELDICTRFIAHDVAVAENQVTHLDVAVTDWVSAAPRAVESPFGPSYENAGARYRLIHREVWNNPFEFDFPRQAVTLNIPGIVSRDAERLLLLESTAPETALPFQLVDEGLFYFTELPRFSSRVIAVYECVADKVLPPPFVPGVQLEIEAGEATAVIHTGRAAVRIPWNGQAELPPVLQVCGEGGEWCGTGFWRRLGEVSIIARESRVLEQGALRLRVELRYRLSDGQNWVFQLTAHQGEAYILVQETAPVLPEAAFEFSLREFASSPQGARGYLHWKPENGDAHWTHLEARERELGRLQEQTPWWIPPQGFAYAMTRDGLENQDYIGVFTMRRGEWIDREFARLAAGPVDENGAENRELDWPYPEMMGSTISMITANTDATGDAFFRFAAFDGERHWGLLVSTLERNDGPHKEISAVQHKCSSPRLQDFQTWHLDEADHMQRPSLVAQRRDLRAMRRKKDSPAFAPVWERICSGESRGAAAGVRFAVEGDPLIAWRRKQDLLREAKHRSKMTLLGRDYSDTYSPVGARPITPLAEDYDLIAASGVFTPEEERDVRAFLMLMGHMYMERDFMNWNFNSRNANFEADRVDVVGAVGLCFHGNPDARRFVEHAAGRLEQSLQVYCTPDSGKWYENPACYYLHASKCYMNLMYHMAEHDICDPTKIPRLKKFLRWGILLLTPPCPDSYTTLRDGLSAQEYEQAAKVRRIAPIGDHAYVGPWVPDHYALMSKLFRRTDAAFADLMLWAYHSGGGNGGYFGNAPLVFAALTEEDLKLRPGFSAEPELRSRRLEGFGAVMRGGFDSQKEFYLLLKQGPGGYRYHRSEGSFLLFADGKPLVYDGGEAGETWRHSTLSFHEAHMPLAAGYVERFQSFPWLDFVQGIHPEALKPGDPVFLSDNCHHSLVPLAYERLANDNPAVSRALFWVKDEYVILHDALNLPEDVESHWHLQVVADGESGNAEQGYHFQGRFGTDLQVLLPGQTFAAESVERHAILDYHREAEDSFAMRHLQLTGAQPDHYLAVLRPLGGSRRAVRAEALSEASRNIGVRVHSEEIEDLVFVSRDGIQFERDGIRFEGKYGAVLERPGRTIYVLLDGTHLQAHGVSVRSEGGPVCVEVNEDSVQVYADDMRGITITGLKQPLSWQALDWPLHAVVG